MPRAVTVGVSAVEEVGGACVGVGISGDELPVRLGERVRGALSVVVGVGLRVLWRTSEGEAVPLVEMELVCDA